MAEKKENKKPVRRAIEGWEHPKYLANLRSAQRSLEGGEKGKAKNYLDRAFKLAPDTYKRKKIVGKLKLLGYNTSLYQTEIKAEESGFPGLVGRVSPAMAIIFLSIALILITFNVTGYAVGEAQNFTRWIGVACFVCGLIFTLIHIRAKK